MKIEQLFQTQTDNFDMFKGVLGEAFQKSMEAKKTEALTTVAGFLSDFVAGRDAAVKNLRDYRKMEAKQKEKVAKIERALKYFAETGNPMPVAVLVGNINRVAQALQRVGIEVDAYANHEVPADWNPAE